MKKILVIFTVLCMMISCVGCKNTNKMDEELNEVIPSSPVIQNDPAEDNEKLQPTLEEKIFADGCYGNVQVEKTEDGYVFCYDPEDLSEWTVYQIERDELTEYAEPSDTNYSDLMIGLGEDGIIVAGKAQGERRSYQEKSKYAYPDSEFDAYTFTEFKIEKVFYGNIEEKVIQIRERYGPVIEKDRVYVQYPVIHKTRLVNDETVLMFLKKNKDTDWYTPVYVQYPLGSDYADYSEEKLTELLDYYRGKEQAYKYRKIPLRWPKSEQSNEEIVEWLSENIVVQLAAKHHIIVWPHGHVNEPKHTLPSGARKGYNAQSDQFHWEWRKQTTDGQS